MLVDRRFGRVRGERVGACKLEGGGEEDRDVEVVDLVEVFGGEGTVPYWSGMGRGGGSRVASELDRGVWWGWRDRGWHVD